MLKSVNPRNHLTPWGSFQYYFLWRLYEHFSNYLSLRRFNSIEKHLIGFASASTKFEGISSLTNNISPPPFEFLSNLYGVLNLSIKKFPMRKLSSIFVSETSNMSILPLISSDSVSNLFLIERIF